MTDLEPGSSLERSFLIVDDSQGFLELIESFVQRNYPGARVNVASTGEEALQKLSQQNWSVVLLDYLLPDFDGVEVLAEVRKRKIDTAVIMVTGEGDERLAADLFRMGAYDYLVKSGIDPVSLRRTLDQVLMRRDLEQQILTRSDELADSSRELEERSRALDTAYESLRQKKEELRFLSDSLEATVSERTAELRATTTFLNTVLDSASHHFIIATGDDGLVLTFNRGAEIAFERSAEEVVSNLSFRRLFREGVGGVDDLDDLVDRCRAEGSVEAELCCQRANGHFTARVALSPLRGSGSSGSGGLVIVGLDITHERELERQNEAYIRQIEMANIDLRKKNQEILEANRLKSAFLANVSHELRTPLNAIIGYSDLLAQGIYGELTDRQLPATMGIGTRAQDLLRLINDVLDLAKIEADKMDVVIEEISLTSLMSEIVETAQVLSIDKNLEIRWQRPDGEITLRTDRHKLRQVMLNLVNNAVKFTEEGLISIETSIQDRSDAVLVVRDSGIGIPKADLEAIFDEFRQVDGTSTRAFGGTGLGLAISSRLAAHLGGQLSVESILGEGSVFTLRIPAVLGDVTNFDEASIPVALDPEIVGNDGP